MFDLKEIYVSIDYWIETLESIRHKQRKNKLSEKEYREEVAKEIVDAINRLK